MRKSTFNKLIRDEKGQALLLVLILILLGSLIIAPLLAYMSTGLKVGKEVFEEKMYLSYAADAGVEDALWEIKHEKLSNLFSDYTPYDYYKEYEYPNPFEVDDKRVDLVNGKDVDVTIQNVWIPKGIAAPSPSEAKNIIDQGKLRVFGSITGTSGSDYQIKIFYYYDNGEDPGGAKLKVETIGIWLPPGFHYEGKCNLADDPDTADYSKPYVDPYKSGEAVMWNFGSVPLNDFPGSEGAGYPMVRTITFKFSPSGQNPWAAVSWIETTVDDIDYYAWDADTTVYAITSTATDAATGKQVTVDAYTAKSEFCKAGSAAIEGDYQATGNTLMRNQDNDSYEMRERLYYETSATISNIPSSAEVEAIYLYWSGWENDPKDVWGMETQTLPATKKVNQVALKIEVGKEKLPLLVTADVSQVLGNRDASGNPHGWSYSCFVDLTDKKFYFGAGEETIKEYFKRKGVSFNGNAKYTVGHAFVKDKRKSGYSLYEWKDSHSNEQIIYKTDYPLGSTDWKGSQDQWSYAAWSVVIIYSSPEIKGHYLSRYDTFRYAHNDSKLEYPISGFLAPADIVYDPEAAKITCFVGEGDNRWTGDSIILNGVKLSNSVSPKDNVWNSKSPGLTVVDGIDIDTFSAAYPVIKPGATEAMVVLPTKDDSWNLVYIILSFRSKITTSGILSYIVR